jgi:CheY-like chemotaxis protein
MSEPRKSVPVADDDAGARLVMQAALRKAGYDVRLASGGHEAVQQFASSPYDMLMAKSRASSVQWLRSINHALEIVCGC